MSRSLKLLKIGTAIALSLVVLAGSVPVFADANPEVVSVQPLGPTVLVKVRNSGSQPHGASVTVQATVLGIQFTSSSHVNLAPGQTAIVPVPFVSVVQNIITVGLINDDSNPL